MIFWLATPALWLESLKRFISYQRETTGDSQTGKWVFSDIWVRPFSRKQDSRIRTISVSPSKFPELVGPVAVHCETRGAGTGAVLGPRNNSDTSGRRLRQRGCVARKPVGPGRGGVRGGPILRPGGGPWGRWPVQVGDELALPACRVRPSSHLR